MPAEQVTMRKIKDILRLKWACGLSNRQVAASCGVARSTVAETLYRATAAGLAWPLPAELDDTQLETRLYPTAPSPTCPPRAMPDWATVHQELMRKGGNEKGVGSLFMIVNSAPRPSIPFQLLDPFFSCPSR